MLCKWCGAKLPDHATKCKRCGKDIPAISDCGGFYDLVPSANKLAARGPVQDAPKLEVPVRSAERKSGSGKGSILSAIAITLCVVLIAVVLLDVKVRLEEGSGGRDRDDEDIGTIIDLGEDPGMNDPGSTDPSKDPDQGSSDVGKSDQGDAEGKDPGNEENDQGRTDVKKLPLEEQELQIQVEVEVKDEKIDVSTRVSAGDMDGEVSGCVDLDDDPSEFTIEVDMDGHGDLVDIEIKNLVRQDPEGKEPLFLELEVNDEVFGKMDGEAEFILEFRFSRLGQWETLDAEMFQITRAGAVVIPVDTLQELLGDEGSVELRVTYTRASKKGGTFTLVLSGLKVDAADHTEKK